MIFRSGYLGLGHFQGAPVRVHWTLPVSAFLFSGMRYVPGAWVGVALIILVHEIGHALIVRAFGLRVVGIDVHGLGGECRWAGNPTERQRATIAWGGVLAQLAVLVTTPLWAARIPPTEFVNQLVEALTATNLIIALINLLPLSSLDGGQAWRLFRVRGLLSSLRDRGLRRKAAAIQRQLDALAREGEREAPAAGEKMGRVIPLRRPGSDRSKRN
jgi:Zn-dependent protease